MKLTRYIYEIDDLVTRPGHRRAVLDLYRKMYKLGSAVAANRLGLYYLTGVVDGYNNSGYRERPIRAINLSKARKFLTTAFRRGDDESPYCLVYLMEREIAHGHCVNRKAVAAKIMKLIPIALAFEHGERRGNLYYSWAECLYRFGGAEGKVQSVQKWKMAARLGCRGAWRLLAKRCGKGYGYPDGIPKNLIESLRYFRRVIEVSPDWLPEAICEVRKICSDRRNEQQELKRVGFISFLSKLTRELAKRKNKKNIKSRAKRKF